MLFERCLESVTMKATQIVSVTMDTGETIKAKVFVDATYEGDLFAAANVSYYVGREPKSAYGESLAGQWQKISWKNTYQFCRLPISPFVKVGKPKSGLLPEIASDAPGKPGQGDHKVQALISVRNSQTRPRESHFQNHKAMIRVATHYWPCLLYTSDAADE